MPFSSPGFTAQAFFWCAFLFFALAKLLSSAYLILMGDYRSEHRSPLRRFVSVTSKVTPSFVVLSAAAIEFSRAHRIEGGALIVFAVLVGFFAFYVVNLRKRGRFFGAADLMLRSMSPGQVKAVLMVILGVILSLVLRTYSGSIAR